MPKAFVNGVNLYYEVTGKGFPLILGHEFCADFESWTIRSGFYKGVTKS